MTDENEISFSTLNPFRMHINYTDNQNKMNVNYRHVHSVYEIYINISGNVSFVVEDRVYPIVPGSVVISKPYQSHHCILNSDENHRHFWILFDDGGNGIFNDLFQTDINGNLIVLADKEFEIAKRLCGNMLTPNRCEFDNFSDFFLLMTCLKNGRTKKNINATLSDDIVKATKYINDRFSEEISISEIAKNACMSISTFERHFKNQIGISPCEYLQSKRISNACAMLDDGSSVQEACLSSGFTSCSYFIKIFKKAIGVTPNKYKNSAKGYADFL